MTTSTCWPRTGPATYRATTQEEGLRREAYSQVEGHLMASPQVVELAPRTLSRWRDGFEPRWDYQETRSSVASLTTVSRRVPSSLIRPATDASSSRRAVRRDHHAGVLPGRGATERISGGTRVAKARMLGPGSGSVASVPECAAMFDSRQAQECVSSLKAPAIEWTSSKPPTGACTATTTPVSGNATSTAARGGSSPPWPMAVTP